MRKRTSTRERRWSQWTEKEARVALAELAASGESAAAFARRIGVSAGRVAYWQKRMASCDTPDFVPVDIAGVTRSRCLEVVAAWVVVRVREDLDANRLADLVEAIGRRVSGAC
jgi:hypothetical protein